MINILKVIGIPFAIVITFILCAWIIVGNFIMIGKVINHYYPKTEKTDCK
jgi:hypothetical protein